MFKRIIAIVLVLSFGLATTFAAPPAVVTAKVIAVDGNKVQVSVEGERAPWMRKGAVVKVSVADKVIETAAKVTELAEKTLTITTKEEATVKVGDSVTLQKGRAMSGC